jgi:hypothetical protein
MDDLVTFLRARLDEDEAGRNEVHRPRNCGSVDRDGDFDPDPVWCGCGYPARVLREVATLRRLVDEMASVIGGHYIDDGELVLAEHVIRLLATAYSGHPDYRGEWKP